MKSKSSSFTAVALAAAVCVFFARVPAACAQAPGAVLHAGDVVMCEGWQYSPAHIGLYRVDPNSFAIDLIAFDGNLVQPERIAVAPDGTVWVADRVSGLVAVASATGAQTLVASVAALGGTPHGVCVDPAGGAYCTLASTGVAAIVHVGGASPAPRVVTSGGELVSPLAVTLGPDGALYVADEALRPTSAEVSPPWGSEGGIVRVDVGGGQTLVAFGGPFLSPFDIAFAPDGWIVTSQWGSVGRRAGGFRRTRPSDGYTEMYGGDRSWALAWGGGELWFGDCISISQDCYPGYRKIVRQTSGASAFLPLTALAVVPDLATPAVAKSWGAIKGTYR